MKHFLLTLLSIAFLTCKPQKFEWVFHQSEQEDASEIGRNIDLDKEGNIYVNSFKEIFGGSGGASTGGMFRYKLDANGNLLQTTQISGNRGAVWDKVGNMYTVFESIKKYDKNGVLLWDSIYSDFVFENIQFIDSNSLVAVGFRAFTSNIIMHAFDTNGNTLWHTEGGIYGYPMCTDNSGTIYAIEGSTGTTNKVLKIGADGTILDQFQLASQYPHQTASSPFAFAIASNTACMTTCDYKISYYNTSGAVLWQKGIKGGGLQLKKMKLDKFGNLYLTGEMVHPIDYDGLSFYEYHARTFMVKLTSSGDLVWCKIAAGLNGNSSATIYDFAFSDSNEVIFTGLNKNGIFEINTSTYALSEILVGKISQSEKAPVSVNKWDPGSSFSISPVPSSGGFELRLSEPENSVTEVYIYNSLGQAVYSASLPPGSVNKAFSLESNSKGIYYVKCSNEKGVFTQKVIKQ